MGDQMRMNLEEDDRLSVLSDDLIHKILSFVGIKDVIRTSVLSPRWRYLWTSLPHLTFSCEYFSTMHKFSNFVLHVLHRRNNQAQLSSVDLYFRANGGPHVLHLILNRLFSLNVQQAKIRCLFGNGYGYGDFTTSQTLKHILYSNSSGYGHFLLKSTSELSSLTTLHLDYITLHDDFFSKCPNLENLTLICCTRMGTGFLSICHPRLSNLTVDNMHFLSYTTNVATPQLKSLTITNCSGKYLVSAPDLASLLVKSDFHFTFSTDGFHSLEKAELDLHNLGSSKAPHIIDLLQKLHNVKVLSVNMDIIKLLNSSVELIRYQVSPFVRLKSLKILPNAGSFWNHGRTKLIISTEVKNYLLNGSLSEVKATVTEMADLSLKRWIGGWF